MNKRVFYSITVVSLLIMLVALSITASEVLAWKDRMLHSATTASVGVIVAIFVAIISNILLWVLSLGHNDKKNTDQSFVFEDAKKQVSEENKGDLDLTYSQLKEELKAMPMDKFEPILKSVAKKLNACQGVVYKSKVKDEVNILEYEAGFAFPIGDGQTISFQYGEGLCGQVAKTKKMVILKDIPEGYIKVLSGLGETSQPATLVIIPLVDKGTVLGVLEIAFFRQFSGKEEELMIGLGEALIIGNMSKE